MIATLLLLATLAAPQDTMLPLSPRAVAMLDRFPPPRGTDVTVRSRFSRDTVWLGEQVELVTATWFRRDLRERLRRQPSLRTPSLSGLWSAPASVTPVLAETRRVDGVVYDLYVSHQTLFPLGAGVIEAPPAVLTYAVPSSTSFFAPEERRTVTSAPARLVVREIPASLAPALGSGPTAHELRARWEVPNTTVSAGTPVTVALAISGEGNVSLWPAPEIGWPPGARIYSEPTDEQVRRPAGIVAGDKRFTFTLVIDSAGAVTLPRVRYPYFDPATSRVVVASASPVTLAVQAASAVARAPVPASRVLRTPVASLLVRRGWPLLLLLAMAPLAHWLWRRRRRARVVPSPPPGSTEELLRRLLGAPADATPGRVEVALRRRGVAREEARAVRRWLEGVERHRWAADHPPPPDDAAVVRVVRRLREGVTAAVLVGLLALAGAVPLHAQWDEAIARYRDGDAAGAERLFGESMQAHPTSPDVWLDLGAARWMHGDDVGATAAWLAGLEVAPRDRRLHDALEAVQGVPAGIRQRAPTIPFSRDELVLVALVAWLVAWAAWRRHPRIGRTMAVVVALAGGGALLRTLASRDEALVRPGVVLRISPVATAPQLAEAPPWSVATLERRDGDWWLVRLAGGGRGWLPADGIAPLSPLD